MSNYHGSYVWYELMTTDSKSAETFYRNVIGWTAKDSGVPGVDYRILSAGATKVAGLMTLPPEASAAGARPKWIGYILTDDVDEYTGRVKKAGGSVHHAPSDIPSVGRFSVVADPYGAVFALFKPTAGEMAERPALGTPGTVCWHELHAGDGPGAFAFYSGLFGWTKTEAMDMGPMGVYQLFATGDAAVGGMMTKHAEFPAPSWLYYFNVDGIDAAMGRVKDNGGQVLMGPQEVPGGSWIIQCLDPQGAMFAVVSAHR